MKYWIELTLCVLSVCLVLRVFIGEPCTVPSDSMAPTIIPGDRLWINKYTYGAQLPPNRFSKMLVAVSYRLRSLYGEGEITDTVPYRIAGVRKPRIGDIVVFEHPYSKILVVKRVAEILPKGSTVTIDSKNYEAMSTVAQREGLSIFKRGNAVFIDNRRDSLVHLKQSYYFLLGDNQEHSYDSKEYGYIPYSFIIGCFNRLLYSVDKNQPLSIVERRKRIFKKIE